MRFIKKFILNRYTLIFIGFVIWMYYFDDNSIRIHNELDRDIENLQSSIDFYKEEIEKDKKIIQDYDDKDKIEKFARETYLMKKKEEDIYIIEPIEQ